MLVDIIIIVKNLTTARQKTTSTMAPSTRSDFVTKKKICCKLTLNNSKKETKIDGYFFTVGGWIEFEWWRMKGSFIIGGGWMTPLLLVEDVFTIGNWILNGGGWMDPLLLMADGFTIGGWVKFEWWRINDYWTVAD